MTKSWGHLACNTALLGGGQRGRGREGCVGGGAFPSCVCCLGRRPKEQNRTYSSAWLTVDPALMTHGLSSLCPPSCLEQVLHPEVLRKHSSARLAWSLLLCFS